MIKKIILAFVCFSVIATAQSQNAFQLPNPSFEQWDGGNTSEPTHWNSFSSSDGTYASLASTNHHYRRAGGRPGSNGSFYLTIYTKSIMGIKANGNMTTGRIHAGAVSATSSENYNYTQRSNSEHCQPFTATPDSMYVWVSFYAADRTSKAHVEAIIHGDRDFKAPNDVNNPDLYKGHAVASTYRTSDSPSEMEWTLLKVPFIYDGNDDASYILINITTNEIPGEGSANDSLSVDDIVFIYSAWLNGIALQGTPLTGFNKGQFDYAVHVDNLSDFLASDISVTPQANDASVDIQLESINDSTRLASITVTAEDGVTVKQYHIYLCSGEPGVPVGIQDADRPSFQLYPNPAHSHFTVVTDASDALMTIHNMKGELIMKRQINGSAQIDVSHLPQGCYVVNINGVKRKLLLTR